MKNFEISFSWIAVQSSQSISYFFPAPVSSYIRSQYRRPAIYRWLIERDGKASTYIGETENLERRLYHYLKPGPSQKTNRRVREFLDEELAHGASIEFDVLCFEPFVINGREYSPEKLWEKEVRCFLENLLITQLSSEVKKLNQLVSMPEKIIRSYLASTKPDMNPEQLKVLAAKVVKQAELSNKRNSE